MYVLLILEHSNISNFLTLNINVTGSNKPPTFDRYVYKVSY